MGTGTGGSQARWALVKLIFDGGFRAVDAREVFKCCGSC